MVPREIPGLSHDKDWGAGMIEKGLRGQYKEPCARALQISEMIYNNPELLDVAWRVAMPKGGARKSIAALTLWLARGREVHDARDGVRGSNHPCLRPMASLLQRITEVEKALK